MWVHVVLELLYGYTGILNEIQWLHVYYIHKIKMRENLFSYFFLLTYISVSIQLLVHFLTGR